MVLLPPEMKDMILSYLDLPEILHLGQTCRDWHLPALRAMYRRDAVDHHSRAIKCMAHLAKDEYTTDLAIQTLAYSKEYGQSNNQSYFDLNTTKRPSIQVPEIWALYYAATALHWAVWNSNVRLAKKLLDEGAFPRWSSRGNAVTSLANEGIRQKLEHYRQKMKMTNLKFAAMFSIFVAFLKEDRDMLELLLKAGAGPEAVFDEGGAGPAAGPAAVLDVKSFDLVKISILHFAAADRDADIGLLQLLFDRFSQHINSACTDEYVTPLHVALKSGSTRAMQLAVNTGAEKEARDIYEETPLVVGVRELSRLAQDAETFEEHITCLRSFVDLGGDLNPPDGRTLSPENGDLQGEGNVVPGVPHRQPTLEGGTRWENSNVANELVLAMLPMKKNHPGLMMVRQLLLDFANQGLMFAQPALWLPSPLYLVMHRRRHPQAAWLFAFLTERKATIHAEEAGYFFLGWCETRLWPATEAAWWPHIESISQITVSTAYVRAFSHNTSEFYDMLERSPLAAPRSEMLVEAAFASRKKWSWRVTLAREFEDDDFLTSFNVNGDGILHLTVRFYLVSPDYSAAEAIQDISTLVARGANIALQNRFQHNPLQFLHSVGPTLKEDLPELVAYLETLL